MLMLKCQNMKIEVRSKTLVNIILLLLYMESCCGFTIDREGRDISASFDQSNCNSIPRTFASQPGRCKCDRTPKSSIASTIAGTIACVENEDIDTSCKFVEVENIRIDTIHDVTISNCAGGSISRIEFWNMRQNKSGYWHHENDVYKYVTFNKSDSISLCNGRKFNGLLMRIKIRCGSVNYQCLLVKVYGSRKYPIPRFAETNETGCKSSSTNTITTAITTTTTKAATTTKNATKTIKPLSLNPPDDDKNLVIVIATVASVATLIIIILLICICRRAGHKQKDVQDNIDDSTEQQNNHTGQSTYSEAQKSDAYAKFTDEYTTIIFKSSPKADGPKPQYSELGLEYQDIKPVYSELSGEHQTNIDEPFYREVDEPDGGEFPQPSDAIYHTVEEQTSSYEENNYYSAVETLPDELSSPTPVYAKVKK